jgi:hypothetical protein
LLIYYIDIEGQNGLIAGITHMRVKQRTTKRKNGNMGFDLYILAEKDLKGNEQRHYPLFRCVRFCTLVKAYDEETGRSLHTWNADESATITEAECVSPVSIQSEGLF